MSSRSVVQRTFNKPLKRQQIQSTNKKSPNNYGWAIISLSKHNFNPIMKWKNIPDVVLSVYMSILHQLVPIKVYRVKKQKEKRLRFNVRTSIMWLLCYCPNNL